MVQIIEYDLIVIGGGPGGYMAAIRAAQLGMKTALIEKEHLGGICLNWGCIPTKSFLRSAEILDYLKSVDSFGLSVNSYGFDIKKIVQRSRAVSKKLTQGVQYLLKKNKVIVLEGAAQLGGNGNVEISKNGEVFCSAKAPHIIIATGAKPKTLPLTAISNKLLWTYYEALAPESVPNSLLVVGSGAVGVEFASFYNALGSDVTIVEALPNILPAEEEEISAFVEKQFEQRGISIKTSAKVVNISKTKTNVCAEITLSDGRTETIHVDRILSAIGIEGNVEDLGLENTQVTVTDSQIVVDEFSRTSEVGVYAIGDVAGAPMLAHKASHEGVICVEKIAKLNNVHPLDKTKIPSCIYAKPQVASVGLTEKKAKMFGYKIRVGNFPFNGNGKAITLGEPDGFVKTIFDKSSGELLGAHMVGSEVTELIHGFAIAIGLETTEVELMRTVFPHPTLSEMMHESVLDAYDRAIHI